MVSRTGLYSLPYGENRSREGALAHRAGVLGEGAVPEVCAT